MVGAVVGIALGILSVLRFDKGALPLDVNVWPWALVTGAGAAIAGAISGKRAQVFVPAVLGAAIGWVVVMFMWRGPDRIPAAGIFGIPAGAVLGAIAGAWIRRRRFLKASKPSALPDQRP